jgi:hypothetical protein
VENPRRGIKEDEAQRVELRAGGKSIQHILLHFEEGDKLFEEVLMCRLHCHPSGPEVLYKRRGKKKTSTKSRKSLSPRFPYSLDAKPMKETNEE